MTCSGDEERMWSRGPSRSSSGRQPVYHTGPHAHFKQHRYLTTITICYGNGSAGNRQNGVDCGSDHSAAIQSDVRGNPTPAEDHQVQPLGRNLCFTHAQPWSLSQVEYLLSIGKFSKIALSSLRFITTLSTGGDDNHNTLGFGNRCNIFWGVLLPSCSSPACDITDILKKLKQRVFQPLNNIVEH